jgi:hypothetical protein
MAKAILLAMALLTLPALAETEAAGKVITFDVASGGVLGSLVTALVMWLNSQRKQRTQISPDPLNVKGVPPSVKSPTCDAIHKGIDKQLEANDNDHASIFPRLTNLESRVSVLEGVMGEIRTTNKSVDDKLTILLRRPR